jgi:hypothetical protein
MIRAFALALVLFAPQDDLSKRIDEVLSRLNDDAVEVRDAALKELVGLGPPALPLLQARLEKLEAETKGRVQEACRRIEAAAALARVLPPLRKVTLEAKDKPLKEVVEEIARQTGLPIDPGNGSFETPVTLSLKDALPLEALDAACQATKGALYQIIDEEGHGMAMFRRRRGAAPAGSRIALESGTWVPYPAQYVRHYKVRVTQVSLNKVNAFDDVRRTGQLSIDLQWPPDVKPDRMLRFRVSELKDEQGRSLLQKEDEDDGMARERIRRGWGVGAQHSVQFKYPEAGAKKIGILRGEAGVEFPKDVRTVVFEKPAETKGKIEEVDGLKITLKDCKLEGKNHTVVLEMTGRLRGAAGDPDDGAYPFSWEDVEVLTESGERPSHGGMSGGGGGGQYTWTLNYRGNKAEALKEVRVRLVLTRHADEFKFELKDIPFPD